MNCKAYTSITGDKDFPREDIEVFDEYSKFRDPVMNAKIYKILAHQFIDTDISIWLDGNIELLIPPEQLVEEYLGDGDMWVMTHPERDCIYEEAPEAAGMFPHLPEIRNSILNHVAQYKELGYQENNGLYECNVIIRRHSQKIEDFNNAWWSEICTHSQRDQLSFPFVMEKFQDIDLRTSKGNVRNHKYFKYTPHPLQFVKSL